MTPSFMLLTIAVCSFFDWWIWQKNHADIYNGAAAQRCEAFVDRVLDDKQIGTRQQVLDALRYQRGIIRSQGDMSDSLSDNLRFAGWMAFVTAIVQAAVVCQIWQTLKQRMLEPNAK